MKKLIIVIATLAVASIAMAVSGKASAQVHDPNLCVTRCHYDYMGNLVCTTWCP
jgi:hypothetical protein